MKNLVLSAMLTVTASQAAGCIIVADDGEGAVSVSWSPVTAAPNGDAIAASPPPGATTAIIYAQRDIDARPFEDAYFISDRGGLSTDLPEGEYDVWVRFTDDAKVARYAESGSQRVIVEGGSTTVVPNYSIFVDHAFYLASWNLRPGGGAPVQCSQIAGENGVAIDATDGAGLRWTTKLDCEAGVAPLQAITRPMPSSLGGAKDYTIKLELLNTSDVSIGSSPVIIPSEAGKLDYGNKFQPLPVVDITVR